MKTIETERLILRGWQLEDLDDLYEYAKNPNVGLMQGWEPHSSKEISLNVLKSFIEDDDRWAIVLKENRKVIGLEASVNYSALNKCYWRWKNG